MTRLLITGATGFLGEPCVHAAVTYFEVHATARGGVVHRCDLLDGVSVRDVIDQVRPTHLLHLAWIATPRIYWTSPENHRWTEASKQLLIAFARAGGQRAVIAGTCAEYDWRSASVCQEHRTPVEPQTRYGKCKLELARWADVFARERGVSLAWARLFWMYGPREHPSRLVPSVVNALLAGLPAACSSGKQCRDFLHVADVADALIALVRSSVKGPVNIGSGVSIAVRDVIECVAATCGRSDLVRFGVRETPASEPPLLVADIARLRDELGWRPRIPLEHGLRETVGWWRVPHAA